jgi:hypothetical protein
MAPIDALTLSTRALNTAKRAGCKTIEDLERILAHKDGSVFSRVADCGPVL